MAHLSEKLSFKWYYQFFTVRSFLHLKHLIWKVFFYQNCSLMVPLNRTIYQKMWKMSVLGLFNKIISFITELIKKPTIYDLLFLIGIYSLKNINKYQSEMKNQHQSSFLAVGWLAINFSRIFFTLSRAIKKNKGICAPSSANRVWEILTADT